MQRPLLGLIYSEHTGAPLVCTAAEGGFNLRVFFWQVQPVSRLMPPVVRKPILGCFLCLTSPSPQAGPRGFIPDHVL